MSVAHLRACALEGCESGKKESAPNGVTFVFCCCNLRNKGLSTCPSRKVMPSFVRNMFRDGWSLVQTRVTMVDEVALQRNFDSSFFRFALLTHFPFMHHRLMCAITLNFQQVHHRLQHCARPWNRSAERIRRSLVKYKYGWAAKSKISQTNTLMLLKLWIVCGPLLCGVVSEVGRQRFGEAYCLLLLVSG